MLQRSIYSFQKKLPHRRLTYMTVRVRSEVEKLLVVSLKLMKYRFLMRKMKMKAGFLMWEMQGLECEHVKEMKRICLAVNAPYLPLQLQLPGNRLMLRSTLNTSFSAAWATVHTSPQMTLTEIIKRSLKSVQNLLLCFTQRNLSGLNNFFDNGKSNVANTYIHWVKNVFTILLHHILLMSRKELNLTDRCRGIERWVKYIWKWSNLSSELYFT